MGFPPLEKSPGLWLSWIGGFCGGILLILGDVLPFQIPFATPGSFFLCIVEYELFFALLIWPLFVRGILGEGLRPPLLLVYVGMMLLLAMPIILIGANVASVPATEILRSQALVAALATFGGGMAARLGSAMPWYLLGAFWISAAHPYWFFLQDQMGARAPSVSVYLSPFWGAAVAAAAPAWVQAGLYGVLGTALLLGSRRKQPA